jgi:hypothetical protein
MSLTRRFIVWAIRRTPCGRQHVIAFKRRDDGSEILGFYRYAFMWHDEYVGKDGKRWNRPPWWRPFNMLLHFWCPDPDYAEEFHDHPRWSITLCLRGKITEHTPWSSRELHAGSIVIRSRKAIHRFTVAPEYSRKTWTLFIVGRRNHWQNTYSVISRKPVAA